MGKILAHEHFLSRLKHHENIEFFDDYIIDNLGRKVKIKCRCKIDNYEWYGRLQALYKGHGCIRCSGRKKADKTRKGIDDLIQYLPKHIEVIGQIKSNSTPVKCKCIKHGVFFEKSPNMLKRGYYCYKCAQVRVRMTTENFLDDLKESKLHFELVGEFTKLNVKTLFKCTKHNITWKTAPRDILKNRGCSECWKEKLSNCGSKYYCETFFERYPERKNIPAFLYFIRIYNDEENFYKVGITTKTVPHRVKGIIKESKNKYKIEIIMEQQDTLYTCWEREQYLFDYVIKTNKLNYKPKIKFSGKTECFKLYENNLKDNL